MCCSNCALYPMKSLLKRGIDVKGFWFNPNIYPLPEYEERLNSLGSLEKFWGLDIEYEEHYGFEDFLGRIGGPGDNRCLRCYAMRLEETAKAARKMNLDGFTTSLLVSPYQQFDAIAEMGKELGKRYALPFYLEDFRVGYRESIPLSRELGLYRQKYCGCVYSVAERAGRKSHG
ncbi:MAG TPA: epoxyqueuosine reductase QueH [Thermodesulfovibrionales bacterium]|nr:epoxyqueuosine reductase QueH [Thermodesulfovibrionales bacterium]